jgi:hypothetical protein
MNIKSIICIQRAFVFCFNDYNSSALSAVNNPLISQAHNPGIIIHKRASEKDTVNAVQKTAVSRNEGPGILDLGAALQDRFPKIAELADKAHSQSET